MPGAVPGTNKKAIWSLVLGLLGLFCCGFFTGIPAVILANMAKKEIPARGEGGAGLATAGLVLGIIAIIWGVISVILAATGNFAFDFSTS
jgi:putative exporter of polyketide antibiotics